MNTPTRTASLDGGLFTVSLTAQCPGVVEVAGTGVALLTVVLRRVRLARLVHDACGAWVVTEAVAVAASAGAPSPETATIVARTLAVHAGTSKRSQRLERTRWSSGAATRRVSARAARVVPRRIIVVSPPLRQRVDAAPPRTIADFN
jgi:hypothetical protein